MRKLFIVLLLAATTVNAQLSKFVEPVPKQGCVIALYDGVHYNPTNEAPFGNCDPSVFLLNPYNLTITNGVAISIPGSVYFSNIYFISTIDQSGDPMWAPMASNAQVAVVGGYAPTNGIFDLSWYQYAQQLWATNQIKYNITNVTTLAQANLMLGGFQVDFFHWANVLITNRYIYTTNSTKQVRWWP